MGSEMCIRDRWKTEPAVDRVANGFPSRVDRIACLGNAVVPLQARTAFERLMGAGSRAPVGGDEGIMKTGVPDS